MHAKYRKNLTDGKITLKDKATVRDLCNELGIPLKPVRLIFVNGKQANIDTVLAQADTVYVLPRAIGGG